MSTDITATGVKYTEENMVTLKDAAHIRQNPGVYVGNTQSAGLHHLVYEIVSNSVDEALAGFCTHIRVVLHADGSVSVIDDGRGIPVGTKEDTGKSALEEALADRFREVAYLNRNLGITVVDERDGKTDTFRFEGGIAEYVVWLNEKETPEHSPIYVRREVEYPGHESAGLNITVEVALQYN